MATKEIKPVLLMWTEANNQTYHMTFDCVVQLDYTHDSEITMHPVESGADFTDHIRPVPDSISLTEAIISNTPIFLPDDFTEGAQYTQVTVKGPERTIGNTIGRPFVGASLLAGIPVPIPAQEAKLRGFDREFDRIGLCINQLHKLRDNSTIVSLVTERETFDSMALEHIGRQETAKNGTSMPFSITVRKIRIGSTVPVEVPAIPTKTAEKGRKGTKEAAPPPPVQSESVLFKLFGD